MSLQIRVKKMQKSFCSSSFKKVVSSSVRSEKKRSPFPLLFPSLCALRGLEKKNLFGDEMNSPLSSLYTKHHHDGSLFFDSGSAREQSRFCKQGTIHERRALCRLFRVLSFPVAVSYARALRTEGYMSEMFFSVKFYHLSLCTRGTRSSQSEEKGLQNAFFYYEENMSRDVNEDLFDRE
jgi:hypothetical protein